MVILSISIIATTILSNSSKKLIFLDDKKKDFVATESITNFLMNSENVRLLENKKYDEFGKKTRKLTEIMVGSSLQSAWDFELSGKEGVKTEVIHDYPALGDSAVINAFETDIFLKQTELKYWKKCGGICK